MNLPTLPSPFLCRLLCLFAAGALRIAPAALGATEANPAVPAPSVPELGAALRVVGLPFTDREQVQMQASAQRTLEALTILRQSRFPNALAPALVFDPRPTHWSPPPLQPAPQWMPPSLPKRPPSDEDLAFLSVAELAGLVRSRQVTSLELARLSLDRLRKHGPALHCVVAVTEEHALAAARSADAELAEGRWRGPLHGIPYGAKDLLATRGYATTWGAAPFTNQVLETNATVIQRLQEAGAILVAKLSLGELAMGDTWFGGQTRNPWQPDKGSSGSSAGSAAAVAAGLVPFALGSETLGSIVSPATVCGVSGLRPSFGRVPRTGAMTLCWSLDKLGPLARTAEDCALVLQAIHGPDGMDPSCIEAPCNLPDPDRIASLRVGVLQQDLDRDGANRSNHLATLTDLRNLGLSPRVVTLPSMAPEPLWLILHAEAAAAFDELTRNDLDDLLVQQGNGNWPNLFRSARLIPAVEYLQANRLRRQLIEDMDRLFREIDVLVAPAWTGTTLLFSNMTGHPCVVVPNGEKHGGNPATVCFLSGLLREHDALSVAVAYQRATRWHRQRPDLNRLQHP